MSNLRRSRATTTPVGQFIYAYCRQRTNQVLYTFRHKLQNKDLKQLPDIGANLTPPKIRPDEWRPLWTLSLPPNAEPLGLRLFKGLRDFRRLHELCWEPPEELSKVHTEDEIREIKEKIADRGGSKSIDFYDYIRNKKRHIRTRVIMNQKDNSIADLAALLLKWPEWRKKYNDFAERHNKKAAEEKALRDAAGAAAARTSSAYLLWETMLPLSKQFEQEGNALQIQIRKLKAKMDMPRKGAHKRAIHRAELRNKAALKKVEELELRYAQLEHSHREVIRGKAHFTEQIAALDEQIRAAADRAAPQYERVTAIYSKLENASEEERVLLLQERKELLSDPLLLDLLSLRLKRFRYAKAHGIESLEQHQLHQMLQAGADGRDLPAELPAWHLPYESAGLKPFPPSIEPRLPPPLSPVAQIDETKLIIQWSDVLDRMAAEQWPDALVEHRATDRVRRVAEKTPYFVEQDKAKTAKSASTEAEPTPSLQDVGKSLLQEILSNEKRPANTNTSLPIRLQDAKAIKRHFRGQKKLLQGALRADATQTSQQASELA